MSRFVYYLVVAVSVTGAFFFGCREDEYCDGLEDDSPRCEGQQLYFCDGSYSIPSDRNQWKFLVDCGDFGLECSEWTVEDGSILAGCQVLDQTCEEYFGESITRYRHACINNFYTTCWSDDSSPIVQTAEPYCDDI
jgi:hypothetical protein